MLYEFKPYLLIISGVACIIAASNTVIMMGGLTLLGMGGIILKMRSGRQPS